MTSTHTFHIPVMGIGYTIDSPVKVAHFGIDSVISLVDDILIEKLRKMYCGKYKLPYQEITEKVEDFRAKRITSYLNLINKLAEEKIEELRSATQEKSQELRDYFQMLPDSSSVKEEFHNLASRYLNFNDIRNWLRENVKLGSIDVNIMTKIDKDNYVNNEKLPPEYNDAHAALRGYANSDLRSSVVLSAGMNPRLYGYLENFDDFYPDSEGNLKKKIVLKVSDFRSALIQGKFLAKKGLWVSEYRIESGLNCGGHAFATDGYLMGPILAEFRDKRHELYESIHELMLKGLSSKNRPIPPAPMTLKITAQGGVGTSEEHNFLIDHYQVDSVGWGTPFLLVPEAVSIDDATIQKLIDAREDDLYLSNISPLGVPFNSLRSNSKDIEKLRLADEGIPGSNCPKKYVALNNEFTEKGICPASRHYQKLKLKELSEKHMTDEDNETIYQKIIEKSCICVGLGTSALLSHNMETKTEGLGVSVCPGPNMAFFSKKMSLKEITDHIYGRSNVIQRTDRPNMFIKELDIYIKHLKSKFDDARINLAAKHDNSLLNFGKNLNDGIEYYHTLFSDLKGKFEKTRSNILIELENYKKSLHQLLEEIENFSLLQKETGK